MGMQGREVTLDYSTSPARVVNPLPLQPLRSFELCNVVLRDVGVRVYKDVRPQLSAQLQHFKTMLGVALSLDNDDAVYHNVCSLCLRDGVGARQCALCLAKHA